MLPTPSQIASPRPSSRGGRGADARLSLPPFKAGRAPETIEQSVASVEDILRREPGFAEPGEMTRRFEAERYDGGTRFVGIAMLGVFCGLIILATALAYPLVLDWAR